MGWAVRAVARATMGRQAGGMAILASRLTHLIVEEPHWSLPERVSIFRTACVSPEHPKLPLSRQAEKIYTRMRRPGAIKTIQAF